MTLINQVREKTMRDLILGILATIIMAVVTIPGGPGEIVAMAQQAAPATTDETKTTCFNGGVPDGFGGCKCQPRFADVLCEYAPKTNATPTTPKCPPGLGLRFRIVVVQEADHRDWRNQVVQRPRQAAERSLLLRRGLFRTYL